MHDRNLQSQAKVEEENKGLATLLAVVAFLFLVVGYIVGKA